jgi:hypothetical protein
MHSSWLVDARTTQRVVASIGSLLGRRSLEFHGDPVKTGQTFYNEFTKKQLEFVELSATPIKPSTFYNSSHDGRNYVNLVRVGGILGVPNQAGTSGATTLVLTSQSAYVYSAPNLKPITSATRDPPRYSIEYVHEQMIKMFSEHYCIQPKTKLGQIKSHISRYMNLTVDVVSSDICDEDREKCDYARSISKKTRRYLDWFRPSRRVITLHPVLLYYAVKEFVAPNELWAATYIDWRTTL